MSSPILPTGLAELAPDYDAILCDVWGVIHNGREAFPAACAALARYREERGPVVLISNAPRPSKALYTQLDGVGAPREAWSAFVTSGDATRALLAERTPGPVWKLGPSRDDPLYAGLDLEFADAIEDAVFICATGPFDEENETPEDYRARLELALELGLEFICANPDRMVQKGDRLVLCAGAIADLYAGMGGKVTMAGKPHEPIYRRSLEEAALQLGRPLDHARVLCIGDGVSTDVLGAQRQGLDCLFLWSGVHAADLMDGAAAASAERAAAFLAKHEVLAKYAMPELVW
jgi:HAD superfamily hydrolase (TIGR01459 family)